MASQYVVRVTPEFELARTLAIGNSWNLIQIRDSEAYYPSLTKVYITAVEISRTSWQSSMVYNEQ